MVHQSMGNDLSVADGSYIKIVSLALEGFLFLSLYSVWRENPFLTTTATQLGRGLSYGGCTEIQG